MADPGNENIHWDVTAADEDDTTTELLAWAGSGETPQEKAFDRAKAAKSGRSSGLGL